MNYTIDNEAIVSISDGKVNVKAELWAASAKDIPAYNGINGKVLMPGSIALVPSESKIYVLDFSNKWCEWGSEEE